MEFHEKLQELRKQKNLTQEELSEILFVSRTAISKWESGRGYPSIDSLKAIAEFFGVTIDELLSNRELICMAEKDSHQKTQHAIGLGYNKYNGQQYYYRKNLQGDIVAILDECGCTRGTYEYDAWGKIIWQGGSELLTINPFRYRGYYYDEETGLYYLNSRYYDPETGRFISPDSLKYLEPTYNNGLNLYAYCLNNPVRYSDPTGCSIVLQFIISLLAYAGYAVVSIWDETVRHDMSSINWNPFNADEDKVIGSSAVSFYKGVPVFRMDGARSGSFFVIGLANHANANDLKHEWGHSVAYWITGPVWGALCYAIPSAAEWGGNHWQGKANYYRRPWEAIADIFGGADTNRNRYNPTTALDREIAIWYLVVASLFGPFSFFFLI